MASLVLPDPRMEMPELLTPGQKPVGNVVVDWSHPLARGLTSCNLMQPMRDIVSGSAVSATNITPRSVVAGGMGVQCLPGTAKIPIYPASFSAYSFVVVGTYNVASTHTIFGTRSSLGNAGAQWRVSSAGKIELIKQSVAAIAQPSHSAIGLNQVFTFGGTMVDGVSYAMYLNGKLLASGSPVSCTIEEAYLAWRTDNAGERWRGTALFQATYIGAILGAGQMQSLTANPYQFLIPA